MKSNFRLGALLAVLVAVLALAPAALAKGGDGGGGGTCAQILSFTNTPVYKDDGSAGITTAYTIRQGCVDERAASVSLIIKNESTGFTGTSVTMMPLGTWSYSNTWAASFGTRFTFTLTVYAPNGKLQDTQKQTVTALDQPVSLV